MTDVPRWAVESDSQRLEVASPDLNGAQTTPSVLFSEKTGKNSGKSFVPK